MAHGLYMAHDDVANFVMLPSMLADSRIAHSHTPEALFCSLSSRNIDVINMSCPPAWAGYEDSDPEA